MKNSAYFKIPITVILLTALIVYTSSAQITITKSDMPEVGKVYIVANDTTPTVTPGSAGANQTWNLNGIKNVYTDSEFAIAPSATPYFSDFPTSNLVLRSFTPGFGYEDEFDNLSADSLVTNGYAVPVPFNPYIVLVLNTSAQVLLSLPATYNKAWKGSFFQRQKYSYAAGDSIREIVLYSYTGSVDGWGNVTTPVGTFNSLRMNTTLTEIYDSAYQYTKNGWQSFSYTPQPPIRLYDWFANGKGSPVAELDLENGGNSVSSASYLVNTITGINEIKNSTLAEAYPNPASSFINVIVKTINQAGYIKILDITGREIQRDALTNGKIQLNTSAYANGMYLYLITDMSGNLLDKGKFTIIH